MNLQAQWPKKGDEHSAYAPLEYYGIFIFTLFTPMKDTLHIHQTLFSQRTSTEVLQFYITASNIYIIIQSIEIFNVRSKTASFI